MMFNIGSVVLKRTKNALNISSGVRLLNISGSGSASQKLKETCLINLHKKYGAKLVDFAGFRMPVDYKDNSINDSAKHTRTSVSIFDVSHMLQTEITAFMESLTTADIDGLNVNQGTLSVFTNEQGGIRDDLIITKTDKDFLYLENASNWRSNNRDVNVSVIKRALIAVQGPESSKLLQSETNLILDKLYFMNTAVTTIAGIPNCRITRCGYTGEDGFEISLNENEAEKLVEKLLSSTTAEARLAGLGARNVLRLEAGLCLYGSDITEDTTPGEAGLAFVVAKRRRQTLGFPGAAKIVEQLETKKFPKKRVGFISEGGRSPRSHLPILDPLDRAAVGFITSGSPSAYLGKNIAMGYVDAPDATPGRVLAAEFDGKKRIKITVTKLPFIHTNYYIPKKL